MLPTDPDDPIVLRDRSLARLQQLSDAVFAITMTLMVLQFSLPNPLQFSGDPDIRQYLIAQLPALSLYLGTFVLLAFYWIVRVEQFEHCQRTDSVHLWLNLIGLMFVIIVPYANGLVALHRTVPSAQILYSGNLALIGLFSWLSWFYASQDDRLTAGNLMPPLGRIIGVESAIEPVGCLLSVGVSCIAPTFWSVSFLILLPAYLLLSWWKQRATARAAEASGSTAAGEAGS